MPWGGAGGQNIEHPHTLVSLSSFFFVKYILILLARCESGELRCPATALILIMELHVFNTVQLYIEPSFCLEKYSKLKDSANVMHPPLQRNRYCGYLMIINAKFSSSP